VFQLWTLAMKEHTLNMWSHFKSTWLHIHNIFNFLKFYLGIHMSNSDNNFLKAVPSDWYSCECVNHPSTGLQVWSGCRDVQVKPCDWLPLPDSNKSAHSSSEVHMSTTAVSGHHAAGSRSPATLELQQIQVSAYSACSKDRQAQVQHKLLIFKKL
jgi:hypothetical protein